MALATQCPHCQTTFRVAHDQLKLRAGLVRCGHCKEIFNGIEHLLPPVPTEAGDAAESAAVALMAKEVSPPASSIEEFSAAAAEPSGIASTDGAESEIPASHQITDIDFDIPAAENAEDSPVVESAAGFRTQVEEPRAEDPLQRMTLMDFTRELPESDTDETVNRELSNTEEDEARFDPQARDELDEAIEDLQRKPWRGARRKTKAKNLEIRDQAADTEDEPGFLKRGRRQQRLGRKLRIFFGIGSFVLLIAALAQGTYLFRNQIAGFFPQLKPALTQICGAIGCRINLPAQITSVSIESSELQTLATGKDMFVLTTLLRSYSRTAQEWPYIELTLNDANEKPLLRRVFKPADYLISTEDLRLGFSANSERTVKLSFALSQIKASGYRVYLFYP